MLSAKISLIPQYDTIEYAERRGGQEINSNLECENIKSNLLWEWFRLPEMPEMIKYTKTAM